MSGPRFEDREERSTGGAMDRRSFVHALAVGVGGSLLGAPWQAKQAKQAPQQGARPAAKGARTQQLGPIGIQLYTVRKAMEKSVEGTLADLARIGYKQVELAGLFGKSPREFRAILDRLGLTTPSSHIPLAQIRADFGRTLDDAGALGHRYIVCPFVEEPDRTADGFKRIAADLSKAGAQARRAGIQLAYHNHDFEFKPLAGDKRTGYEILLAESDPQLVKMELDLYWAVKAGHDPVALFMKQPGRFPLVHVKDMAKGGAFADVGTGTIDFARIFGHAEHAGIKHWFVERDDADPAIDSARASYRYLRDLRW